MKLKRYKPPITYSPPNITLDDASITEEDIFSSERHAENPEPINDLEKSILNTNTASSIVSNIICGHPPCRKRMTIEESYSTKGIAYYYCRDCRTMIQKRARNKRYKRRAQEFLFKINKDEFFISLDKHFPGFARFSDYSNITSTPYYVHFLHFRTDLYPIVAEAFSEAFFPVEAPSLDKIYYAKKILNVITTQKKCRNCNLVKPTWYIREQDPKFPSRLNILSGVEEIKYLPPPTTPASLEDILTVLDRMISKQIDTTHLLRPNQFNKSSNSKDLWKVCCKTCFKEK